MKKNACKNAGFFLVCYVVFLRERQFVVDPGEGGRNSTHERPHGNRTRFIVFLLISISILPPSKPTFCFDPLTLKTPHLTGCLQTPQTLILLPSFNPPDPHLGPPEIGFLSSFSPSFLRLILPSQAQKRRTKCQMSSSKRKKRHKGLSLPPPLVCLSVCLPILRSVCVPLF